MSDGTAVEVINRRVEERDVEECERNDLRSAVEAEEPDNNSSSSTATLISSPSDSVSLDKGDRGEPGTSKGVARSVSEVES